MSTLAYAALDVTKGLTPELVKGKRVVETFRKLEENTYHYGMSTRSLFTLMATRGPSYLHAGTNSETGLLATNKYQEEVLRFPLVFIFPSDGTFWSGNPFCVLDAEWVTEEQREAAELFGFIFDGHPDLRPLLTEEGLGYYILRKTHPLAEIEEWQEDYLKAAEEKGGE